MSVKPEREEFEFFSLSFSEGMMGGICKTIIEGIEGWGVVRSAFGKDKREREKSMIFC